MRKRLLIISACAALAVAGCVTKNPNYQPLPADQNPATNPQYVANQAAISNAVATLHGANNATAPINPYAGVGNLAIEGGAGLITAISLLLAGIKSRQAAAHASALDTVGVALSKADPTVVKSITDAAANSSASDHALITAAINNNSV